jgi:hypothetical protein
MTLTSGRVSKYRPLLTEDTGVIPKNDNAYTHAATYCVIIQTQRTHISGRNSNGTKHSGGPPVDGHEKIPKPVGVLYLQTRF